MDRVIVIYAAAINIAAFAAYGIDKQKAKRNNWRTPERVLIMLAVIGGSIGSLAGMIVFRHKTKKPKFYVGIPVILLIQIILIILLYIITPSLLK